MNVLRLQNKGSHNMRTFEIPASGGFMLQERSNEVLEFFEEGKEIECFSSVKELKDKINFSDEKNIIFLKELLYKATGRNRNVCECRHFQGKSKNEYNLKHKF